MEPVTVPAAPQNVSFITDMVASRNARIRLTPRNATSYDITRDVVIVSDPTLLVSARLANTSRVGSDTITTSRVISYDVALRGVKRIRAFRDATMSVMKLTFWGAAGTVTGSMHLLESGGKRYLLDCGLYQGRRKDADLKNRKLPFAGGSIDAVVLS